MLVVRLSAPRRALRLDKRYAVAKRTINNYRFLYPSIYF